MNATGQLVLGPALPAWGAHFSEQGAAAMEEAGVEDLHEVRGFFEIPLFAGHALTDRLYLYSVVGPKLSTIARFVPRFEDGNAELKTVLTRLGASPENGLAMSLRLMPMTMGVSRPGWGAFRVEGFLTQTEDPAMFAGVFYEVALDLTGQTAAFLPTASERHYAAGDLSEMGAKGAAKHKIWGYLPEPFAIGGVDHDA